MSAAIVLAQPGDATICTDLAQPLPCRFVMDDREHDAARSSSNSDHAVAAAKSAGLRYVSDSSPGICRRRNGNGFRYVGANGRIIRDKSELGRIAALVIPPAWEDVWICPDPTGHIQAVGRDQRGRKQYRYHPRWREVRDGNKFEKLIDFAEALPQIRKQVDKDLDRPGMPREKILAAVVRLLESTFIRVGNDEYAKHNDSYGLTTLRDKHAEIDGRNIRFKFKGKGGVTHEIDLEDRELAKVVRKCQELPGYELFQYLDDAGEVKDVGSADVNEYLRHITGEDFTAKDFRTWAGTVLAAMALQEFQAVTSQKHAEKNIVAAVESVAKKLGNTRTVCRKCYIHPAILETYLDGTFVKVLKKKLDRKLTTSLKRLRPEEAAVLVLLRERLNRELPPRKPLTRREKRISRAFALR